MREVKYIKSRELHRPIILNPRPLEQLNGKEIMKSVQRVLQSDEDILLTDDIQKNICEMDKYNQHKQQKK